MEPCQPPSTNLPTFTSIDTHSVIPSIRYIYQALEHALTDAQQLRYMEPEYIQNQGNDFSTTIDVTLKLSQDGIVLARDALTFFAALENGHNDEALTDYLDGLHKFAEYGLGQAQQCNQQLLGNFELISKLRLKSIENSVYSSETELEVEESRLMGLLLSGRTLWCLPLPFVVPSPIKHGTNQLGQAKLKAAILDAKTPNFTYEQLEAELDNVRAYLSHLVTWWSDVVIKICQIRDFLKCSGNSRRLGTPMLGLYQQIWTSIRTQHSTYRDQVSMIQDNYPVFRKMCRCSSCREKWSSMPGC